MRPHNIEPYEWDQFILFIEKGEISRIMENAASLLPDKAIEAMKEGLVKFFEDPNNLWEFFMFTFDDHKQAGRIFRELNLPKPKEENLINITKVILHCFSLRGYSSKYEILTDEEIKLLLERGFDKEFTKEEVDIFLSTINEVIDSLEKIIEYLKTYLETLDKETKEEIFSPSSLEKWKVGFDEAIWKNPARRAIALGILLSLTVTHLGAYLALKVPFFWAIFGDLEALSAGFLAFVFSRKGNTEKILKNYF